MVFCQKDDDVFKFEPAVIYAMSKLQLGCRTVGCNHKCEGVCPEHITEFICEHFDMADGDIESQVMTSLTSFVKSGIVCALQNGSYRLIGPSPKEMAAHCISRVSHGGQCCCLALIDCFTKSFKRQCCSTKGVIVDNNYNCPDGCQNIIAAESAKKPSRNEIKEIKKESLLKVVKERRSSKQCWESGDDKLVRGRYKRPKKAITTKTNNNRSRKCPYCGKLKKPTTTFKNVPSII